MGFYLNKSHLTDAAKGLGLTVMGTTLLGFYDEKDDSEKSEDLIPDEDLPEINAGSFPKKSEIPYIDDFDDSGLERFVEHELDIAHLDNFRKKSA